MVCLQRKNRDCALSEYNYLRLKSDLLAQTLLGGIYSNKILDARAYRAQR